MYGVYIISVFLMTMLLYNFTQSQRLSMLFEMDYKLMIGLLAVMISSIATMLYESWKRVTKGRNHGLPPGAMGWPLIGETLEFVSCAVSPHPESFMDRRRAMYGKVFKSHIFGSATIVSTDEEVNRYVFQSDAKTFVPSYPRSIMELMGKSSILLINGSLQRKIHGLVGSFFKSSQHKSQITAYMEKYIEEAMDGWKNGQLIHIQEVTKHIAFQVLVKSLINLDPGEDMQFLKKQFQEFNAGLMSLPIKLPGTRLYRSLQAREKMIKLIQKIMEERRRISEATYFTTPRDILDVLLNDNGDQLTDDLILDNMIDMMIPGEDSVPVLMTLSVKFLSDCPLALRQLEEENMELHRQKDRLGEQLDWNDYMSLSFTQNVITETLRMGNVIIGAMRKAMKRVEIKGYTIPKGWCVFMYFRSVHLDGNNYADPYKFNPWRWQDKDIGTCSFTPFGGGKRLCPGMDLARLETSIFLNQFANRFRWVAEDDSIINFPTVRMKNRMPVRVHKKEEENLIHLVEIINKQSYKQ
ncbi:Cytochrome P450 90D2 [Acorus gramineus]|uniref:Cytochrome P450 90D2 n=1 Tax=Acorus gramineus TaxID=55184 RepID=A0AAV9A0A2_ACOGR|nr:Cytochrome P450 90D2 [Acorus gramineus]